jgi:hypothetical protein
VLDLLAVVADWLVKHPQILLAYLPLLLWGHTWQRAGRLDAKWSWPLLGLIAVGFAYWLFPGFRRVVHAALLFGWLVVFKYVGLPGRLVWGAASYWMVLAYVWRLFGWRAILAGAPLNVSTVAEAARLRRLWRQGKLGVKDSHQQGAILGRPRMGTSGVIRAMIRPGPGKSLLDLIELANRGSVGASMNYHGRHLGAEQLHRVLIRPTGGPEGEGELIALPEDPLRQEFASPRVVR